MAVDCDSAWSVCWRRMPMRSRMGGQLLWYLHWVHFRFQSFVVVFSSSQILESHFYLFFKNTIWNKRPQIPLPRISPELHWPRTMRSLERKQLDLSMWCWILWSTMRSSLSSVPTQLLGPWTVCTTSLFMPRWICGRWLFYCCEHWGLSQLLFWKRRLWESRVQVSWKLVWTRLQWDCTRGEQMHSSHFVVVVVVVIVVVLVVVPSLPN